TFRGVRSEEEATALIAYIESLATE
ncbi:MAG: cytochrome c2, partial [Paracoccaceae bacterium]